MKIIFLSFSKCAGTAIRNAIVRNNRKLRLLPGWGRSHVCQYSRDELNGYDLFAGHYDWADLDCLSGDRFVFTVLRKPFDRVVSHYVYSRAKAARKISAGIATAPIKTASNQAILTLPPVEYFTREGSQWRDSFLDEYDNVYSYYFFYRRYFGQRYAKQNRLPMTRVLEIALRNLARLDYVATFANLESDLHEVERLTGLRFVHDLRSENQTEFGAGLGKRDLALQLDPSGQLTKQIEEFSGFDNLIYETARTRALSLSL